MPQETRGAREAAAHTTSGLATLLRDASGLVGFRALKTLLVTSLASVALVTFMLTGAGGSIHGGGVAAQDHVVTSNDAALVDAAEPSQTAGGGALPANDAADHDALQLLVDGVSADLDNANRLLRQLSQRVGGMSDDPAVRRLGEALANIEAHLNVDDDGRLFATIGDGTRTVRVKLPVKMVDDKATWESVDPSDAINAEGLGISYDLDGLLGTPAPDVEQLDQQ